MTTARQQAREKVNAKVIFSAPKIAANDLADAASDVWEPLLREAVEALDRATKMPGLPLLEEHQLVTSLREALG